MSINLSSLQTSACGKAAIVLCSWATNKATQFGPKPVVTFIANNATNAPSIFGRWFWRYKPMG